MLWRAAGLSARVWPHQSRQTRQSSDSVTAASDWLSLGEPLMGFMVQLSPTGQRELSTEWEGNRFFLLLPRVSNPDIYLLPPLLLHQLSPKPQPFVFFSSESSSFLEATVTLDEVPSSNISTTSSQHTPESPQLSLSCWGRQRCCHEINSVNDLTSLLVAHGRCKDPVSAQNPNHHHVMFLISIKRMWWANVSYNGPGTDKRCSRTRIDQRMRSRARTALNVVLNWMYCSTHFQFFKTLKN